MFAKALVQDLRITLVLGGDITSDGCWKIDRRYPFFLLAAKKLISGIPAKLDTTSVTEPL
jgi:hypothetical protein